MSTGLQINLLGVPRFSQGGAVLECSSRKAVWLVAHVLLRRTQVERHDLARLLWAEAELPKALGSLRVALTRLPRSVLECIEVHRHYIGPAREVKPWLDVDEFASLCRADDLPSLLRATRLYAGDLIDEVDTQSAPEFFDWVSVERGRLREMAHAAHLACAERLRAAGERAAAVDIANAWLARDPADEAMNRLLMAWLVMDAGHDRALAQFDAYRRALAVTRGAAPSPMMVALAERLQHRGAAVPDARLAAGTALIGREQDLARLTDMLADPGCRLLTLLGMGGLGKTRLAMAWAETAHSAFEDGVFVVGLADVASPALFAQTVARACGLQPTGAGTPIELLITFFRRRHALLVLDNLEHLLAADASVAADIAALLAGTGARFKLLATSREPVRLQEEWLYPLEGLEHPPHAEEAARQAMTEAPAPDEKDASPRAEQRFAAVQLFISRARQANPRFTPDTRSREVTEVCALLEGLPLGIELAAGWVGEVDMPELLQSLQSASARLASTQLNRPARQRSLGAVVAYSWERLSAELQQVLAGLAVLSGTFSSEAAGHIASATEANLKALAGRSLLMAREDGRWHIHEVVRQFAWEICGAVPARQEAVRLRRDQFYLGWLKDQTARLHGPDESAVMRDIDLEAANVRLAWQSRAVATSVEALAALAAAAPVWFDYLECRCFFAEGIGAAEFWLALARKAGPAEIAAPLCMLGLFQRFAARTAEALNTLDAALIACDAAKSAQAGGSLEPHEVRARALATRAFTHLLLGDPQGAEQDGEASLAAVMSLPPTVAEPHRLGMQASACRVLGLVLLQTGRREAGRARQQEALQLAQQTGRPSLLAAAYNNLALAENHLGNHDAAEAGYQNALAAWRGLQATVNIGRALHNLGVVATRKGDHALALERYRTALETLRRVDDRNLIALNLMSTGDALLRLGRPAEAVEPASQALEMAERDGHALPALDARIVLAQAAIACSEYSHALLHLLAAMETPGMRKFSNVCADVVVTAARLVQDLRTPKPLPPGIALRWAGAIGRMENVSLSIRKDAADFLAAHPQAVNGKAAQTAATLDSLCDEVQTTLQDIAAQFA